MIKYKANTQNTQKRVVKKIKYLEFGEGRDSLIFLHGWGANSRSFLPLVPYLYRKYKIYLLDLPGFGRSGFNPKIKSSFDYADEIGKWIEKKKIKKTSIIGHSFGGRVAGIIAKERHPTIKKLILIAPSGIKDKKNELFYKTLHKIKKLVPPKTIPKVSALLTKYLASRDYRKAGKLLPLFKNIVREDLQETFSKIKVPTLIIWGKEDKELNYKNGKKIQNLIKGSKLLVLNRDHFPFIENAEKIASLIEDFTKK